ncbi:MAG: hypothetical protein IT359_17080 [Gemmatimonadaceae bacterium]|nr:hypothetical protein [Gemmatimonadaceae bacterium]
MTPRHAIARIAVPLLLAASAALASCRPGRAEPVAEFPSTTQGARLAFVFTGDDGATAAIRELARRLARAGIPSVVVASDDTPDSPRATGDEIDRLVRQHLSEWDRDRLLLIGAARGAGMLPFVANRMGRDLRDRVDAIVLVDVPERVSFRREWKRPWRADPSPTDLPILPELERMRGIPLLCLYERGDRDAFCPSLDPALVKRDVAPHSVSWDDDGGELARRVLSFAR